MTDTAVEHLLNHIQQQASSARNHLPILWLADENALGQAKPLCSLKTELHLITNRYDIYTQFKAEGFTSFFSDFNTPVENTAYSQVFIRIAKEKPVTHHLINLAYRLLEEGGTLTLCGEKSEGIKSYFTKARALFGGTEPLQKNGKVYEAVLTKTASSVSPQPWLDDSDYPQLRPVGLLRPMRSPTPRAAEAPRPDTPDIQVVTTPYNNTTATETIDKASPPQVVENTYSPETFTFYSKPGVFGWNKIDPGSAFLIEQLDTFIEQMATPPQSLLDLGCGYGFLTLMSYHLPVQHRVATDNNATALLAAQKNIDLSGINVDLIADDCGENITEKFDLILCNPPFHQGFNIDSQLTEKFLRNTQRLLTPKGAALYVVNQFIPLEQKASSLFGTIVQIAENRSFKVIELGL